LGGTHHPFLGSYLPLTNTGLYDKEIFFIMWKPLTTSINAVLEASNNPTLQLQAIIGLRNCAVVAANFRLSAHLDVAV